MMTFSSSTFIGSEFSGVLSATVIISGGIISSSDINVSIIFTEETATGTYAHTYVITICTCKISLYCTDFIYTNQISHDTRVYMYS